MKKIFKKAISLTMAAAIAVPVGMGTGANHDFIGITAQAAFLSITDLKVTDTQATSLTLSWTGDTRATSYEVSYRDVYEGGSDYISAGTTKETTYKITGLNSGSVYSVRVTASNTTGDNGYSSVSSVKTKLSKMRGVKQDTWYHFIKSADVSWTKLYAADGYEWKWKNSAGKVKKKGTTTSNRLGFDVKNNNVYHFMVRAYQQIDGKTTYTPWKTIQVFEQPWVKSVAVKTSKKKVKKLKITWYKQKGATGYDVYVSKTNKTGSYKKVKSVGKGTTSISISKFKKKKIKGTYYVYVVSKVKTSNGTSKSGVTYMWQTGSGSQGYVSK